MKLNVHYWYTIDTVVNSIYLDFVSLKYRIAPLAILIHNPGWIGKIITANPTYMFVLMLY